MNLLDRYVIRAVLGGVFVVLGVLLTLGALFLFANQQDDIGLGSYTALDAFWFVLLNIPQQVYEMMPIAVLIGALLGLGTLSRGSELTVMRAAGISVWRISSAVAAAGLMLVLFAVVCGEFLAPPLQAMAKQQKLLAKFSTITFAGRGGPWVRDGDLLINVSQQSGGGEFGGMRIFELSPEHDLKSVATATTAKVQPDGSWKLSNYASTTFGGERIESQREASRDFQSSIGGDFLALDRLFAAPARNPRVVEPDPASEAERSRCLRAGVRVLVAHCAHRGDPVRHAARGSLRLRQPAFGGCGHAHAARRAHRHPVLPRAANARKRRRGVRREPGGARLGAHRLVSQRGAHSHSAHALARANYFFAGSGGFSSSSSCLRKMVSYL